MPFPFNYCGEVRGRAVSSSESFQDQFRRRAQQHLEKANAEIEFDGPEVCFHTSKSLAAIFRFDSSLLLSVPSGKFIFREEGTIGYCLDFTEMCLWITAWVLGIFGFFFIFVVSGPLLVRLLIVISLWAIMIGCNFMIGIYRFYQFVDRILNEINKGRV